MNQAAIFSPVAGCLEQRGWSCTGLSLAQYYRSNVIWPGSSPTEKVELVNPAPSSSPPWNATPRELELLGRHCWNEAKELLETLKPTVLVFGNDRGFLERILARRARILGARIVLVQDGSLTSKGLQTVGMGFLGRARLAFRQAAAQVCPERFGLSPIINAPTPPYGTGDNDAIAVTDLYSAKLLLERGVPPKKLHLTGQPRFDRFCHLHETSRQLADILARRYPKRIRVVFATQPMAKWGEVAVEDYSRYLTAVLSAATQMQERLVLLIRPHPAEDDSEYRRIAAAVAPQASEVVTDWDTQTLLAASDGLITAYSTCATEAIILDRPLLLINPFPVQQGLPYHESGVAQEIHDLAFAAAAIRETFIDGSGRHRLRRARTRFLAEFVGPVDGRAALRVADLIEMTAAEC